MFYSLPLLHRPCTSPLSISFDQKRSPHNFTFTAARCPLLSLNAFKEINLQALSFPADLVTADHFLSSVTKAWPQWSDTTTQLCLFGSTAKQLKRQKEKPTTISKCKTQQLFISQQHSAILLHTGLHSSEDAEAASFFQGISKPCRKVPWVSRAIAPPAPVLTSQHYQNNEQGCNSRSLVRKVTCKCSIGNNNLRIGVKKTTAK